MIGRGKRATAAAAGFTMKVTLSLGAALALFAPSCSVALHAQTAAPVQAAATAAGDADSKSIFGMWMIHMPPGPKPANYSNTDFARGPLSMTPYGVEKFSEVKSTFGPHAVSISESNEPTFKCFPPGVPAVYTFLYPVEIVKAPDEVIMLASSVAARRGKIANRMPSPARGSTSARAATSARNRRRRC